MDHLEIIREIPGIALTLVGFTGIVFALRVQASGGWTSKELFQLYAMTITPLTAFFCAFAPDLFSTIVTTEDLIWRLSQIYVGMHNFYLLLRPAADAS